MEEVFKNNTTKILIDEKSIVIYHEDKACKILISNLIDILGYLIEESSDKK